MADIESVSKPYRYARKLLIFKKEIIEKNAFQNLIGMLGSQSRPRPRPIKTNVSKPYRYARKGIARYDYKNFEESFKTL